MDGSAMAATGTSTGDVAIMVGPSALQPPPGTAADVGSILDQLGILFDVRLQRRVIPPRR
jgi:hypothetical protein